MSLKTAREHVVRAGRAVRGRRPLVEDPARRSARSASDSRRRHARASARARRARAPAAPVAGRPRARGRSACLGRRSRADHCRRLPADAYDGGVRLRLYHHSDGARVAYREPGPGPAVPGPFGAADPQGVGARGRTIWSDRYRVVLPDLPLHGDSEDRPRHPYTLDWFADVIGGLRGRGARAAAADRGHDAGAEIMLQATLAGGMHPRRLVLMPNRHARRSPSVARPRGMARGGDAPARCRPRPVCSLRPARCSRPRGPGALSPREPRAADDLIRHAFDDVPGNSSLARSWAKAARAWPLGRQSSCSTPIASWICRCSCCGPTATAVPALDRRRGPRAAAGRPAARTPAHRLPDGVRRPRRRRAGAGGVLRVGFSGAGRPPASCRSRPHRPRIPGYLFE